MASNGASRRGQIDALGARPNSYGGPLQTTLRSRRGSLKREARDAAAELRELDAGHVELQPPAFGTVDRTALQIAQLLKAELSRQETASELYVDSLITIFGIHLLRTYSGVNTLPQQANGGLSAASARRVQEFLNENFTRKLSTAELAAVCGLSPYYFIRAFARTFGQPPHQYVLSLRLAFAEKLLVEGDLTIADISYISGFSSQSHLTAVMRKYRQMTPAELRARG
jgi:AraC family transcriptional regulator